MNLYLVRHGQTAWNVDGRLQGWTDVPLNAEGVEQAERTADFFADYQARQRLRFYAIYSSPSSRAWTTATYIGAGLDLAPIAVPDLREMHGGAIEGLRREEWQARYPAVARAWQDRENLDFGWPGGETRRAFRARALRAITEIVAQHRSYDNLIVVTHGGLIKAYLHAAGLEDPLGPRAYDAANCSITHVQFLADEGGSNGEIWSVGCLRQFNYVEHLQEDEADAGLVSATTADLALQ